MNETITKDLDIITKENSPYKWGEMLTFLRVRFPGNAKSFPFLIEGKKYKYGQQVIAMSDRGLQVGYINSFPYEVPYTEKLLPIKTIKSEANDSDVEEERKKFLKEKEFEFLCQEKIEEHKLDMTLTHVEVMHSGKKVVFYFTAPSRIDFRNLVKDLVSSLKMRVELRQISVRERTAAIGAIGVCGLQTCCSSFLEHYGHASIKMAKNQSFSISPNRLNGVCGQIKCCIKYEDNVYQEKKKKLPKDNSFIKLKNGHCGKVLKTHVIKERFDMLCDDGIIRRYSANIYNPKSSQPPKDWAFPKEFKFINNETSELIEWEEDN